MDAPPVCAKVDLHLNCISWWQPLFYACPPQVSLDQQEQTMKWGRQELNVQPGTHTIKVHFNYLGKPRGIAELAFESRPNETVSVVYKPPFMLPFPGKLRVR